MKMDPVTVTLKNRITVQIRAAVKTDAAALLDVGWRYLKESEFLITMADEFNFTKQQEEAWIRSLNERENGLLIVAVAHSKIVGSLDLRGEARTKVRHNAILGIAIRKEWQRVGLGTALMQTAIRWAKEKCILKNIWLNVHATNEPAIALYRKMGFTDAGVQRNFIRETNGSFTDNHIMGLTLE
ncbi:acetyltransferase [Niabella ginsenosidivorans]|uniref:Acetyltransferase n=1 Tax=Niabella ginsenosidivorans TaxID=1176587 RepID=A0A1A9I0Q0_9BACT|nr:GNAT family N-acetyltransferase [Niabella ginsenosidivorans]ANH80134.1 acetyltransferase [Niabella ginsenosidivorans]